MKSGLRKHCGLESRNRVEAFSSAEGSKAAAVGSRLLRGNTSAH